MFKLLLPHYHYLSRALIKLTLCSFTPQLMQHYEVRTERGAPSIQPKTRTLLIPSKPIDLQFVPRAWCQPAPINLLKSVLSIQIIWPYMSKSLL